MKTKKINTNTGFFSLGNISSIYFLRLIIKSYLSNAQLLLTNTILPVIVFIFLSSFLPSHFQLDILIGIALSTIISIGFFSFPFLLVEWKQSILYKKIQTQLSSITSFFVVFIGFFFIVSLVVFVVFLGGFTLFFLIINNKELGSPAIWGLLNMKDWGWFILGVFQVILISLMVGGFIALFAQNTATVMGVGLTFYLIASFLLGCYSSIFLALTTINPNGSVSNSWGTLNTIAQFIPIYAPVRLVQQAYVSDIPLVSILSNIAAEDISSDITSASTLITENNQFNTLLYYEKTLLKYAIRNSGSEIKPVLTGLSLSVYTTSRATFGVGCAWIVGFGTFLYTIKKYFIS